MENLARCRAEGMAWGQLSALSCASHRPQVFTEQAGAATSLQDALRGTLLALEAALLTAPALPHAVCEGSRCSALRDALCFVPG